MAECSPLQKNLKILWIRNWYVHQINASNNVLSFIVYKCCPKMPFSLQFSNPNFDLGMPVNLIFYLFYLEGHIRERPFNLKGGYGFFLKKYSDSQCCWKKYSDINGGKKKIWFRVFVI
jgi:hypothetical protein